MDISSKYTDIHRKTGSILLAQVDLIAGILYMKEQVCCDCTHLTFDVSTFQLSEAILSV